MFTFEGGGGVIKTVLGGINMEIGRITSRPLEMKSPADLFNEERLEKETS